MKKIILLVLAPIVLLISAETVFAGDKYQGAAKGQQGMIFGQELMTNEELAQHREDIMKLKTNKEREAYRQKHHALMKKRAEERGVTIADVPPGKGKASNPESESGRGVELGNLPE